jgi:hypothetical protein
VGLIIPFLPRGVFDDETTGLMGETFDSACAALRDKGQPKVVQEILARRIIMAARKGERDPKRLRDAALAAVKRRDD